MSTKIPINAVLNGDVNTIIRISKKNKWSVGSIFELKRSYKDTESIKVVILDSKEQVAKYISEEVLTKCYYKNKINFRQHWEKWYQNWNSCAWVVKFGLLPSNHF